jgi:hypothetical protein
MKPLALALILIRVSPLCSKIGVLKAPCLTRTRLPEMRKTAFLGVMVPRTSTFATATLAPSVGAISKTCTLVRVGVDVDAAPQPLKRANPVPSTTISDARVRRTCGASRRRNPRRSRILRVIVAIGPNRKSLKKKGSSGASSAVLGARLTPDTRNERVSDARWRADQHEMGQMNGRRSSASVSVAR